MFKHKIKQAVIWVNLHVLGINLEGPGSVFDVFVMQAKVAERTVQFQGGLWDSDITSLNSSFRWWHRPLSCAIPRARQWDALEVYHCVCLIDWFHMSDCRNGGTSQSDDRVTWIGWLLPRLPSRGTRVLFSKFQNHISPICIVDKCKII